MPVGPGQAKAQTGIPCQYGIGPKTRMDYDCEFRRGALLVRRHYSVRFVCLPGLVGDTGLVAMH